MRASTEISRPAGRQTWRPTHQDQTHRLYMYTADIGHSIYIMAPKQSDGESAGDGNGNKGLALTFWNNGQRFDAGECVVGAACCDLQATTSAIPATPQVPVPPTLCLGLMLHTHLTQLHSRHNPNRCPARHGSSSSPNPISNNLANRSQRLQPSYGTNSSSRSRSRQGPSRPCTAQSFVVWRWQCSSCGGVILRRRRPCSTGLASIGILPGCWG